MRRRCARYISNNVKTNLYDVTGSALSRKKERSTLWLALAKVEKGNRFCGVTARFCGLQTVWCRYQYAGLCTDFSLKCLQPKTSYWISVIAVTRSRKSMLETRPNFKNLASVKEIETCLALKGLNFSCSWFVWVQCLIRMPLEACGWFKPR